MKVKHIIKNLIKIFITIVLLAILFRKIDIENFESAIIKIRLESLLIAIALYLLSVEVTAFKWKILLPSLKASQLSKTCFKAQFYSTVLPGQIFGEASKILDLAGSTETQGKVASSVIIDKITSLVGSTIVGIAGIMFTSIEMPAAMRSFFILALIFLFVLLLSGRLSLINNIVKYCCYGMWTCSSVKIKRIAGKIYRLYLVWRSYSGEGITLFKSAMVGVLNQMLGVFMIWIISNSMNLNVDVIEYCWIMPAVSLILLLPISFGGLGVREISLTGFLALFGVNSENAVAISVIVLLAHIISAVIGAGVVGYDEIKRYSKRK